MFAFTPSVSLPTTKTNIGTSSFTTCSVPSSSTSSKSKSNHVTTMVLRTTFRKPVGIAKSAFGGVAQILDKADEYMAKSVLYQYYNISNPTGEYGLQCTEGSVKGAAEAARIRALNTRFRAKQASPAKKYGDLYENRKQSIAADHICHYEEDLFTSYPKMAATYSVARNEANGACFRYATPETVEEAAMLRFMDIQQNNAANPTGVYNSSCNEGASKFQSEDLRIAALNTAYRNGQKPMGQLLKEKYEQRKYGYVQCHGCNYEEGLVSRYPAIGAAFRSKTYGY